MKKRLLCIIASALLCSSAVINAASTASESCTPKKEASDKPTKAAREEAKRLKKEGWQIMPGALPIENQIDKVYKTRLECNEDGTPTYIVVQATSAGSNYDAAKIQAMEIAKQQIAGQLQSEISSMIQSIVVNQQLSATEAETINKFVASSKNLILQSIGRTLTLAEFHRTNDYGKKLVLVCVAYNSSQGMKAVENALKRQTADDAELNGQIGQIFGDN